MKIRIIRTPFLLAGLAVAAMGCSSGSDPLVTADGVTWGNCEGSTTLQCSELEVPMDYNQANGEKITLALTRLPASGSQPVGSIVFNPGGPGGSGVALIKDLEEQGGIPSSITEAYDVVSFDPRGTGGSTPVDCNEFGLEDLNSYPAGDDEVRELHRQISDFGRECSQKYGAYLQQLGSLNVVRDMEQIRIALGEEKLNFIGYSYGTRLAALFLQQYPANSGRMVLDASVHPESSIRRLLADSLPSLQANLRLFLSQCTDTDPACDVDQLMDKLIQRVNGLASDSSEASQEELGLLGEIVIASSQEPVFGALAVGPVADYLNTENFTALLQFIIFLDQSDSLSEDEVDESDTAQIAVICADDASRPTPDSLIDLAAELNQVSDVFAEAVVAQATMCAGWPEALEPLAPIATDTAPLSLVIGGSTDAQTPLEWSRSMAQSIGGLFIQSEHDGHTVVFTNQSDCIDDLVVQYMQDGLAPNVEVCPVGPDI